MLHTDDTQTEAPALTTRGPVILPRPARRRLPRWLGPLAAVLLLVAAPAAGWATAVDDEPRPGRAPLSVEEVLRTSTTFATSTSSTVVPVTDVDEPEVEDTPVARAISSSAAPAGEENEPSPLDDEPVPTTTPPTTTPSAPTTTPATTTVTEPGDGPAAEAWCMGRDDIITGSPPGQKCIPGDGSPPYYGPGSCPSEQRPDCA
jgi:hypothetical protein